MYWKKSSLFFFKKWNLLISRSNLKNYINVVSWSGDKFSFRFVFLFFVLRLLEKKFSSSFLMLFTQRWHFMRFKQDKIFVICEYKLSETSRSVHYVWLNVYMIVFNPFHSSFLFYKYVKFKVVYYGFLSYWDLTETLL